MKTMLSENARVILERRYLKKDEAGKVIETPDQLFRRVAKAVALADADFSPKTDCREAEETFYRMMIQMRFLPNSPTLMNAGRRLGQLAACFVLPVEDSMDSIFESLKYAAMIHKSGGGTGFSFSRIRPKKDVVISTAGVSSGPLSFMSVYDIATDTVKQGGTRRGANMGILRVDHPDIEAFIEIKNDPGKLNNFNISVALTRGFMDALERNDDYDLVNPRTGKAVNRISSRGIFEKIVHCAWTSGEPGIIFLDRINDANPTPALGQIEATNPCGEQPLLPFESCTLGSVNLSAMVVDGDLDVNLLKTTVRDAVHFLDNVIEINRYPLPQIEEMTKKTRKIGLGVMGFADLLIKLGIAYDSEKAIDRAEAVMAVIDQESKQASADLAQSRGNFPAYRGSIHDDPATPYMRNATTTTIAPTGTISIIADTSSGIEPIFAISHTRYALDGKALAVIHPIFVEMAEKQDIYSQELQDAVSDSGTLYPENPPPVFDRIPDNIRKLFRTSHEIDPQWHVRIQAAFQKYTDNAVSKTVNLPHSATTEDVEMIYRQAYAAGCKGVTIYRYGSRDRQVLNIGKADGINEKIAPRPRPDKTYGFTERIRTGCGNLYVTVNTDEKGMCELFAQMGKTGGCASSQTEAAGRLISLALRSGVKVDAIFKQLTGIRCPSPSWGNGKMVLSCPDAIAQVLKKVSNSPLADPPAEIAFCPECNSRLYHEEGCLICHACGFSKCS